MIAVARVALTAMMALDLTSSVALTQPIDTAARENIFPFAYFLDEEPSNVSQAALPMTARDVVVVKVRLNERPRYLVRREPDERAPPPKYLYRSKFSVTKVISGQADIGENFDVTFQKPGMPASAGKMTMVPLRNELHRDYFVIAYIDEDGQRHLAGYPISEAKYRAWEASAFEQIKLPVREQK